MSLQLSIEEARRFLVAYHFQQTDLPGVFERLGTVQYDLLNPVGRNPDFVFQARIAGYQVDDWHQAAYEQRFIYDAWDKQALLITVQDDHTIFWRSAISGSLHRTGSRHA